MLRATLVGEKTSFGSAVIIASTVDIICKDVPNKVRGNSSGHIYGGEATVHAVIRLALWGATGVVTDTLRVFRVRCEEQGTGAPLRREDGTVDVRCGTGR